MIDHFHITTHKQWSEEVRHGSDWSDTEVYETHKTSDTHEFSETHFPVRGVEVSPTIVVNFQNIPATVDSHSKLESKGGDTGSEWRFLCTEKRGYINKGVGVMRDETIKLEDLCGSCVVLRFDIMVHGVQFYTDSSFLGLLVNHRNTKLFRLR